MQRDAEPAPRPTPTIGDFISCVFCLRQPRASALQHRRNEHVFYDSAVARRSLLGKFHYCISCPGWSKVTSARVVYSRWDLLKCSEVPAQVATGCGCCSARAREDDWAPPNPAVFETPVAVQADEQEECCSCRVPCGRTLDTFDADIIVDASAHQTLCQICRGEGDLVLYRKAGADLSDPSEVFVISDVVKPFDVFNDITFELSKINLRGAAAAALGARMGATIWSFDARAGAEGPAVARDRGWRGEREAV